MEYINIVWFFGLCTIDIQATTHWRVTETGLIQPRAESPFEMARPYDLVAFLDQETRWDNILQLHNHMTSHQRIINKLWSSLKEESNINSWLGTDFNCRRAGTLDNLDWYASQLEDGVSRNIPLEDYHLYAPPLDESVDVPDCKKISSLTFSMFAFEHLEAMVKRNNLTTHAESSLPELIGPMMSVHQFGHWVTSELRTNSSSWLHYNMAALYWRGKGNAPKALECARRAVHYSPREYRDIALLNLGTILHRCKYHEDAIIVLLAAIDHDPYCVEAHFVLGQANAILGNFNVSAKYYEETLKLNNGYSKAALHRSGALCIYELTKKLKVIHKKVNKLKKKLHEYAGFEHAWLHSQAAFLRTMKQNEGFDYNNVEQIVTKMSKMTGQNINVLKKEGDKNSLIKYILNSAMYKEEWFEATQLMEVRTAVAAVQRLMNEIAKRANSASNYIVIPEYVKLSDGWIKKEYGPMPLVPELAKTPDGIKIESDTQAGHNPNKPEEETYEYEMGVPLYPPTMKINRMFEDFDRDPKWPSDRVCKESVVISDLEAVYPVFLPFENKGLKLKGILTHRIGVTVLEEHELPWHPPLCPAGKEATAAQKKAQKQQLLPEIAQTDYLRQKLLEYVSDGFPDQVPHMQEAEIGQRIYAAMNSFSLSTAQMDYLRQKLLEYVSDGFPDQVPHMQEAEIRQRIYAAMNSESAPKWITYTLASLYWRVRNNNVNALSCLIAASKNVRAKFKDVVLTSLASVYLEMGLFDEALQAADEAFKLSMFEPATNFLIAQLNMIKKQRVPQISHLKQTIRVDAGFQRGLARKLLIAWSCLLKQVNSLHDSAEGEVCSEVSPGVSMVCNKDNIDCHISNVQCFTPKESTSIFVREFKFQDEEKHEESYSIDESKFEPFFKVPLDISDTAGHSENFQKLVEVLDNLIGCGPEGCSSIAPEDVTLKEKDCSHQSLQLSYWLHIISFRALFSEHDLRIPPEVKSMVPPLNSPTSYQCRTYKDPTQHFFLDRLMRVDTSNWQKDISMLHQFQDMFDNQDYQTIGAKFIKYFEMHGESWTGAHGVAWWCLAMGHGGCALRCARAAYSLAPHSHRHTVLRSVAAMLLM